MVAVTRFLLTRTAVSRADVAEDHASVAALADAAAALGPVTRVIHAAVTPVQASTERVLDVDLLGTANVLEEFGRVVAAGGSGIVVASMAGHMGPGFSREIELALAYTPTADLLGLRGLPGPRDGRQLRCGLDPGQAGQRPAGARCCGQVGGARRPGELHYESGIIATPLARDEMSGPNAAGYRHMIDTSAAGRMGTPSDVADAAALLLGRDSYLITGSDLLIDGGVIAAMPAPRTPPQQSRRHDRAGVHRARGGGHRADRPGRRRHRPRARPAGPGAGPRPRPEAGTPPLPGAVVARGRLDRRRHPRRRRRRRVDAVYLHPRRHRRAGRLRARRLRRRRQRAACPRRPGGLGSR